MCPWMLIQYGEDRWPGIAEEDLKIYLKQERKRNNEEGLQEERNVWQGKQHTCTYTFTRVHRDTHAHTLRPLCTSEKGYNVVGSYLMQMFSFLLFFTEVQISFFWVWLLCNRVYFPRPSCSDLTATWVMGDIHLLFMTPPTWAVNFELHKFMGFLL